MKRKLYQIIASTLTAIENCRKSGNIEWLEKHSQTLIDIERNLLPRGSGFDNGTWVDIKSTSDKLILNTSFHHMNENGMYDGWTKHQVIVTPSLAFGINLRVTGRDRNGIKEYIGDVFHQILTEEHEN